MLWRLALLPLIFWNAICLGELTLEQKVGQLLMVHFHGEVAGVEARALIQELHVGGIIYYTWANGLSSPEQVRELSTGLQKLALENHPPIPLLIATDQEGGATSRLEAGFTRFPSNQEVGRGGDPICAQSVAHGMGKEMEAAGLNMNLAPVVDIFGPHNPLKASRFFADRPDMVTAFGRCALQGYNQAGIIATLKHFPGYGDIAVDPHEGLPVVRLTLEELEKGALVPFAELAPCADAIMTAHILVPALDPDHPATLSPKTLSYLRNMIGFQGVIIADSLVMDGVLKACGSVDEAAIQAFQAGCDVLLLGGKLFVGEHAGFELTLQDVRRIHAALVSAVRSGRISEERLNEAVARILALKERYLKVSPSFSITSEQAERIAEKIWKNECAGSVEGLTFWKKGEECASMGIGHFIWYPEAAGSPFQETFPSLLAYLKDQGASLPDWLQSDSSCPWKSRVEFYKHIQSEEMQSLRQLLLDTKHLQAKYMARRLENFLHELKERCSPQECEIITATFHRLASETQGLYALIDYINFKGSGTSPSDTYQGQGWGLFQVLQRVSPTSPDPLADFVQAAKTLLRQRVRNAPPERHEDQWLRGWNRRLDTYLSI